MSSLAPIILFVYNRPFHTMQTLEALSANNLANKSDLYIYSDAPKNESDRDNVDAVRNYIKTIKGFKKVNVTERVQNFGLVKSITIGVNEILNKFGKAIILEDDLITHIQFIEYMNQALNKYENEKDVYSITGYSYYGKCNDIHKINVPYFTKLTCTWGWATWKDKWSFFDNDTSDIHLLEDNPDLKYKFNYDNSYDFFYMLKNRDNGQIKSWGVVWYWNVFKMNGLVLSPRESLIEHIGLDGTGENSKNYRVKVKKIYNHAYNFIFPDNIIESVEDRKMVSKLIKYRKVNLVLNFVANYFKRLF